VGLFRKRARLRVLDERECYLRLHGIRSGEIALVQAEHRPPPAPPRDLDGPTDASPALHLMMRYPRNAGRLTGEQLRRELLRRMDARTGEAA
jgi:hypothetical protein